MNGKKMLLTGGAILIFTMLCSCILLLFFSDSSVESEVNQESSQAPVQMTTHWSKIFLLI